MASENSEATRLGQLVVSRGSVADAGLILAVPAVLVAVMWLPLSVRESLVFQYTRPTLLTAVASSFVHLGTEHLAVNLLGYALVVPTAYLLAVATGARRQFRVVFVSLTLSCPVLLAYLNLAIVRQSGSVGFSGVLLALYGYLPLLIARHLEREFDIGSRRKTAPLLFFVGVTVISVLTLGAVLTFGVTVPNGAVTVAVTDVLVETLVGLIAALVLIVALYGVSLLDEEASLRSKARRAVARQGHFELAVAATVLFLVLPLTTFPVDPVMNGQVLNLYVHLLGYAIGFISVYTMTVLDPVLSRTETT
jgi:hypothetical protein